MTRLCNPCMQQIDVLSEKGWKIQMSLDSTDPSFEMHQKAVSLWGGLLELTQALTVAEPADRPELLAQNKRVLSEMRELNRLSFESNPGTRGALEELERLLEDLASVKLVHESGDGTQCRVCGAKLWIQSRESIYGEQRYCPRCISMLEPARSLVAAGFDVT